jgi:hypothetical protein
MNVRYLRVKRDQTVWSVNPQKCRKSPLTLIFYRTKSKSIHKTRTRLGERLLVSVKSQQFDVSSDGMSRSIRPANAAIVSPRWSHFVLWINGNA